MAPKRRFQQSLHPIFIENIKTDGDPVQSRNLK